jgi:hypothetical protein
MYQDRNGNEKSKPSHAQYPERSYQDQGIGRRTMGPRVIINIIPRDPIRRESPSPQTDIRGAV